MAITIEPHDDNFFLFDGLMRPRVYTPVYSGDEIRFVSIYSVEKTLRSVEINNLDVNGQTIDDFASDTAFLNAVQEIVFRKGGGNGVGLQGSVNTFNDLPSASDQNDEYWRVKEGSGGIVIAGYRIGGNDPGIYYSNGTTWSIRRDFDATDIRIDPGQYQIITSNANNLHLALKELTSAVALNVGNRPTGIPVPWPAPISSMPAGYLHCNGQSVSRTTYSSLFAVLGTSHGSVDANSFNVPDYRDMFLRGASDTRAVNTYQADEIKEHNHDLNYPNENDENQGYPLNGFNGVWASDRAAASGSGPMELTGGSETRPKNKSVHWIIKT